MFFLDPPHRLTAKVHISLPKQWVKPKPSEWSYHNQAGKPIGSFLEGPCFDAEGNLLVVDIPFGRIFRLDRDDQFHLYSHYEGWPNGLKVLPDGRIVVADHRLGLVEIASDGSASVLVDGYRGERFRGLNDLTLGPKGWVYMTDQGQSGLQEASGSVYRWHMTSSKLERVMTGIPSPNGLVFNSDASRLYVAATRANAIWRLPMMRDGGVSKVGVFINLSGGGGPDGLAIDAGGGLIVAQPGLGILRFGDSGILTHFVEVPDGSSASNIAFIAPGNREMVVTDSANSRLLKVEMPYAGPAGGL